MERLQKILARAGLASRREAERWIAEGRVAVNGTVVRKLGSQADPAKDSIKVDGKRIRPAAAPLYYAFHKPPGIITTLNDPEHRPDLTPYLAGLGEKRRLFPVGRLDYNTTGLLLLTNDGDFALRLTHPRYGVKKIYRAKLSACPTDEDLARVRKGIRLDDGMSAPARARVVTRLRKNAWVEIEVQEGRKREVRRIFEALGFFVEKLIRISVGSVVLGALPMGELRQLGRSEVDAVRREVGLQRVATQTPTPNPRPRLVRTKRKGRPLGRPGSRLRRP
jgi:23S rRNA pseudouridine2605 synthase